MSNPNEERIVNLNNALSNVASFESRQLVAQFIEDKQLNPTQVAGILASVLDNSVGISDAK